MSNRNSIDKPRIRRPELKLTDKKALAQLEEAKKQDFTKLIYNHPLYLSGKDKIGNTIIVIVSHRVDAFLDRHHLYLYLLSIFAQLVCPSSFFLSLQDSIVSFISSTRIILSF